MTYKYYIYQTYPPKPKTFPIFFFSSFQYLLVEAGKKFMCYNEFSFLVIFFAKNTINEFKIETINGSSFSILLDNQ